MQHFANPIGSGGAINVEVPDVNECPMCHHAIEPVPWGAGAYIGSELQIVLRCPRVGCHRLFIVRYERGLDSSVSNPAQSGYWSLVSISPRAHIMRDFPSEVEKLSDRFARIFNQSSAAEASGLDLICGGGYRKALEFLIKDFLKSQAPDESTRAAIEKDQLGNCIRGRISNAQLKATASRAAWLGNDETHYIRKWEDKDINDLKRLIDLTVHWVSAEIITKEFETSMPAGQAKEK